MKKKYSSIGKNSPLTPEQIAAYNYARLVEHRDRKNPDRVRYAPRQRLTPEQQLEKLNKIRIQGAFVSQPKLLTPAEKARDDAYWRLYDLARTQPGKPKVKPLRGPHKAKRPSGRPVVDQNYWSGTATILPHIATKAAAITRLLNQAKRKRYPPSVPRGKLTQTFLHALLDYDPATGHFQWISGPLTGNIAGYDYHANYLHVHKGNKHPSHDPLVTPDPYQGLKPQSPHSPTPPAYYRGGSIITAGHNRGPIDGNGLPIYKPAVRLPVHTTTTDPVTGLIATTHDFHLVRPYNPMRHISVRGHDYPAWQLAILWMGAGAHFTMQYLGQTPVPAIADPEINTSLTFTQLDNRPAKPVFRDGNTLNLAWENIRPDLPPIYPTQDDLAKAQHKFNKQYRRDKQKQQHWASLTKPQKKEFLTNKAEQDKLRKENNFNNRLERYKRPNCITVRAFNIMQNEWIVHIPHTEPKSFFSELEANAYYDATIALLKQRCVDTVDTMCRLYLT